MAPRKTSKGKRRGGKRRGGMRRPRVVRDIANVKENLGFANLSPNQVYSMENFSLSNSTRAQAVAHGYQYYRIKKISLKFRPLYDTFMNSSTGTCSVPNLYVMIDKQQQFPAGTTLPVLKAAGAKPRRLDDKTLSYTFAPAVTNISATFAGSAITTIGTGAGTYKVSPWLPTNANAFTSSGTVNGAWKVNSVDHAGVVFCIEQAVYPTGVSIATCEIEITYEFKKPMWSLPPPQADAEPVVNVQVIDLDNLVAYQSEPIEDPNNP